MSLAVQLHWQNLHTSHFATLCTFLGALWCVLGSTRTLVEFVFQLHGHISRVIGSPMAVIGGADGLAEFKVEQYCHILLLSGMPVACLSW